MSKIELEIFPLKPVSTLYLNLDILTYRTTVISSGIFAGVGNLGKIRQQNSCYIYGKDLVRCKNLCSNHFFIYRIYIYIYTISSPKIATTVLISLIEIIHV